MKVEKRAAIKSVKKIETYFLEPLILTNVKVDDINRIVEICNQPEVYNNIFFEMFSGKSYSIENAEGFINWANNGWLENQYFVFVIRNEFEKIVGCIDIKENNLKKSEIGFWLDKEHSGIMTNALYKVIQIGKQNGYRILFGDAKPGNIKSIKVMERNGFVFQEEVEGYLRFEKCV